MATKTARLLRLLGLLQTGRALSAEELAERLGTSDRTIRRDVETLRDLDYPVEALPGRSGYRLGAGQALPPLALDDQETVALALSLRAGTQDSVTGTAEAALRALAKVMQVLPARLRAQVEALAESVSYAPPIGAQEPIADGVLLAAAEAIRRREVLRCDYRSAAGEASRRRLEPHHAVHRRGRWYLIAFDLDRADWRTFRLDRLTPVLPTGPRFTPRTLPEGDPMEHLERRFAAPEPTRSAVLRLHVPVEEARAHVWQRLGTLEAEGPQASRLELRADAGAELAWMATSAGLDFTVVEGDEEFRTALRELGRRCAAALET